MSPNGVPIVLTLLRLFPLPLRFSRTKFALPKQLTIVSLMDGRKWMQLCAAISASLLLTDCGSTKRPDSWEAAATQSHPWGYYTGVPVTQWNADGRSMTLMQELRYTDPQGIVWVAPVGSVVDGASIPRSLWSFMGGPF